MSLNSLLGETFAFYEPEFMAITDEQYKAFVSEVPALEQYGHYFDRLLEKKEHVLSQKEEELLAGAGEIFAAGGETFEILDNANWCINTLALTIALSSITISPAILVEFPMIHPLPTSVFFP